MIVCAIAVFMFLSLHSEMKRLEQEIADVQRSQNNISTLSRSDLTPITVGLFQANTSLKQLSAQSAILADKIPAMENELNLANQKLTFIESSKAPVDPKQLVAPR
jgi:prefoldin subunit 5